MLDAQLQVSLRHARIFRESGDYWLEDLGSAAGTWLNGSKVAKQTKQRLCPSDELEFGKRGAKELCFRVKRAHNTVWQQLKELEGGSNGAADASAGSKVGMEVVTA